MPISSNLKTSTLKEHQSPTPSPPGSPRQCSSGWQVGLSVLQCNHHMYASKRAADVLFLVGRPPEDAHQIWAHSYMLVSRSSVFEEMLSAQAQNQPYTDQKDIGLDIPDIEPLAFDEMLRYIYYEEVNLSQETAFSILYAAKKYHLLGLLDETRAYILQNIMYNTACEYLTKSLSHDESEIEAACLRYICENGVLLLASDKVLGLCPEALSKVMREDDLQVDSEKQVYDACVRWAVNACQGDLEDTTDSLIRGKLGDVFHHIRFPCMPKETLMDIINDTEMLNKDEQLDILWKMLTPDSPAKACDFDHLPRTSQRRTPDGLLTESIIRFDNAEKFFKYRVSEDGYQTNAISFAIDRNVNLVGISLFVGEDPMQVHIDVLDNNKQVVAHSSPTVNLTQDKCDIFINDINVSYFMFDNHVALGANQLYTLQAKIKYLCQSDGQESMILHFPGGTDGRQSVTSKSGATVTFWNAVSVPHSATTIDQGQFPQLLFTDSYMATITEI